MKKISLVVIVLVIVGIIGYIEYNRYYLPDDAKFTVADVHYGCYWGDTNQKKSGTPNNWVLVYSGTQSAQWCDPVKANNMVQQ